jgi:hypothetical protein
MLRSDLWAAAFVRRHNDIGEICVVSRRGDAIAGQIFIEIDHLNGTVSLLVPAPASALAENEEDHVFTRRFDRADPLAVRDRIAREVAFDPDLWVLSLETRARDIGVNVVGT